MKILIVASAVVLLAGWAFAADETPWGAEKGGLASRLTLATPKPTVGQPLRLKLEVRNTSTTDASYDDQQAAVNGSLIVTGPDGSETPNIGGSFQTSGGSTVLKPGESRTIFDGLDVNEQYLIEAPGLYRIQTRSRGGVPQSNILTVTVAAGELSEFQKLLIALRRVTPAGWRVANYSGSIVFLHSPTGLKSDATSVSLYFANEKNAGPKPARGQPKPVDLGETKLGHAWLTVESAAAGERWPNFEKAIGDKVRAIQK